LKTVNFIFGVHNHQPVGNFDHVFEEAIRKSYAPFIDALEDFPELHISIHFSGCLLEWLEQNQPALIKRIARLIKRGNVEFISGGFYEPVLAMIPERDRIGQIEMMNAYIRKHFNYQPQGLWLTERVWEPGLAKPIAQAGIKYVTVDDYHFLGAGKQQKELDGAFITEEQGYPLWIFPINQFLRYAIPFKEPQVTIDYLREYATEDGRNVIVMADDGEKFGVWPGTHEVVVKKKWLQRFFKALSENQDWLKTRTFAEYYDNYPPKGRIYLPTASYFEMSEWSLPCEASRKFKACVDEFEAEGRFEELKPFFKGGVWRNFLYIYDEANWMQKKLQYLSDQLEDLKQKHQSENKDQWQQAQTHLWRGSCNCAYWHGMFGGLYLPHLRRAIYRELLTAEKLIYQLADGKNTRFKELDLDRDGEPEILIQNQNLLSVLAPHRGAILQEFSLLDKAFNILNTIKRYQESYHQQVATADTEEAQGQSIHDMVRTKEKGLEKYLNYDAYPRKSLLDHFIKPEVSLEQFQQSQYYEDSDFIDGEYRYKIDKRRKQITFSRDGWVNWQPFGLTKTVQFRQSKLVIHYTLENKGDQDNHFRFGPEFNFAMLGGDSPDRYYQAPDRNLSDSTLASKGVESGLQALSVVNEFDGFQLTLKSATPVEFWRFPVETVSLSEAGFERGYQSSVLIPWTELALAPGEKQPLQFELIVKIL